MCPGYGCEGKSANVRHTTDDKSKQLRHLRELIAALDKRVPRIERVGEASIARDAAALKKKALERLAELTEADVDECSDANTRQFDQAPRDGRGDDPGRYCGGTGSDRVPSLNAESKLCHGRTSLVSSRYCQICIRRERVRCLDRRRTRDHGPFLG